MKRVILILFLAIQAAISFAQPAPCDGPPAMTSFCEDACVICDIDGFTGTNNLSIQGQTFPGFCTTMFHNMSYIAFIAGTTDLTIQVTVTNCTINWGVEIGFFESPDCETFLPITDCNTDVAPNSSVVFTNDVPLVVGQHYYLVMDGSNSDICDWTFDVLSGSTQVTDLTTSGQISGNAEICPDLATAYTTTGDDGAAIFYWTINGTLQTDQSQTVDLTFPADGTYEVCVTAANACDEAPPTCTTVNVVTPETLFINETICDNDCIEVAGEILCQTGNYEYVITLDNGCDSLIFVDLTVLPQAQQFIDINLCDGEAFLIGTTPYTQTGVFIDTIQTSLECDSIVTLDLFIVECEIIGSTEFVSPICNGDANGFLVFSVENGTPPFTYDWSNILDPTIGGVGSTNLFTDNMIAGVPAGTYEINIMDTFGNNTVLFQDVTEPPVLSVATSAVAIDDFNLSCYDGSDGTALASGTGGVLPYSFSWDNGDMGDEITGLSAGLYNVNITDDNGCIQTNNITLTEPDPITFFTSYINPNCDGFETGRIQLDSIYGGTDPYLYALNSDSFTFVNVYTDLASGTYEFAITDDNGCVVDTTSFLQAPDIPVLFLGDDLTVELGCDIRIPTTTNNTTLIDIQWTNGTTLDCDTCLRPFATPFDLTEYTLTVISSDTCSATETIAINVDKRNRNIFAPNAFSPNADGINDYFFINANKSVSTINSLQVFSRWGELVYAVEDIRPNNLSTGWDGYFKGKRMDSGVYIWVAEIEYLDGLTEQVTGDVSILY